MSMNRVLNHLGKLLSGCDVMKGKRLLQQRGQGIIEYALIVLLVGLISVSGLNLLGVDVGGAFQDVVDFLAGAGTVGPPGGEDPAGDPGEDPPEDFTTLFYDNFLDGDSSWTSIKNRLFNGKWMAKDGQLEARHLSLALLDDFGGSDYRLTVGAPRLDNFRNSYQGFGVMFRATGDDSFNGYMFEVERKNTSDPGVMYFSQWVNGYQVIPPIASVPVPAGFDWESPGDLSVDVQGDTFTAYFDGVEVLQGQDTLFTEGTVGVATNYGTKAQINSVTVQGDP
jgi:Flp pilus assembly pilin Flp